MNDSNLGGFEQRLLETLRTHVHTHADISRSGVPTRRHINPARLAIAAAAVAVLTVGLPTVLGGSSGSPAFAVEPRSDGTITVTINRFDDAGGLQAKLEAAGIDARVDYTPWGKTCKKPRYKEAPVNGPAVVTDGGPDGTSRTSLRLRPSDYTGYTLVLDTSASVERSYVAQQLMVDVAEGPVAPCELVDVRNQVVGNP